MTERGPTDDPSLRDLFFSSEPTNWNETSFSDEEVRSQMDRFTRANDILMQHLTALGQKTSDTFIDLGNGVVLHGIRTDCAFQSKDQW